MFFSCGYSSTIQGSSSLYTFINSCEAIYTLLRKLSLPISLIKAGNYNLDKHSIAIELVSWGQLTPVGNNKYRTYYDNIISTDAQYYPRGFRGYNYFEKYTNEQIRTVGEFLLYWGKRYEISLIYNEDMWDISTRALNGDPGVWTHVSYRPASAKSDLHPQPEIIKMLQTIQNLI